MALSLQRLLARVPHNSIGLDLGRSVDGTYVLRAVGVRSDRIQWRQSVVLDGDQDLATALGSFLRSLPPRRLFRPVLTIALGPASIQLKRLPKLPPLADQRALASLVRENVSRFFVRNGVPLVTSALRVDGPGDAWGAAVERPLLDTIARSCAIAKMRVKRIVPAATVLGYAVARPTALESGASTDTGRHTPTGASPAAETAPNPALGATTIVAAVEWADGPATYLLHYDNGRLIKSQRVERHASGSSHLRAPADLIGALGPDGSPFAVAYAAAIAGQREPIAWRPSSNTESTERLRRRLAPAIAMCVVASTAALMSAPIGASFVAAHATRHIRAMAAARSHAMRAADSLQQVTTLLQDAAAFADARRALTPFLAALTLALPPQTALTSIHLDTAGGTLMALTPNASDFVKRLEQVPGLVAPELIGPVTTRPVLLPHPKGSNPEPAAPVTLNEVTVRFHLAPVLPQSTSQRISAHTRGRS